MPNAAPCLLVQCNQAIANLGGGMETLAGGSLCRSGGELSPARRFACVQGGRYLCAVT